MSIIDKIVELLSQGENNGVEFKHELLRLFQQSGAFHFDATAVPKTTIADLNWSKIDRYFDQYNIDFTNETDKQRLLTNVDILTEEGNATVGGLLVFGINPQRHLRNASISFAHFAGNEVSDTLIDKQLIEGTLDYQIDTAFALIKNQIQSSSKIEGSRTTLKPYKTNCGIKTNK